MNIIDLFTHNAKSNKEIWNPCIASFRFGNKQTKSSLIRCMINLYGDPSMREEQAILAHEIAEFYRSLTTKEYLMLNRSFRRWNPDWERIAHQLPNWDKDKVFSGIMKISDAEDRKALLIFGCLAANGYLRHKCVKKLAEYPDTLPFLLLALNDWVLAIRADSYELIMQKIKGIELHELMISLPFIEKLGKSGRRKYAAFQIVSDAFYVRFSKLLWKRDYVDLRPYDQEIKNAYYRAIYARNVFSKKDLMHRIKHVKGSYESQMLFRSFVKQYQIEEEDLEFFLHCRSSIIRRSAIETWIVHHRTFAHAEDFLMDPSKSVRGNVQYLLQRDTQMDIPAYYKEQLSGDKTVIAIHGIGETGSEKDTEILMPFLNSSRSKEAKAALLCIGELSEERGESMYLTYLSSEDPALVRIAYQLCRKWNITVPIDTLMELYRQTSDEQKKCYYLLLLRSHPFWEYISLYFRLYGRVSEKEQFAIESDISHRSLYYQISSEKAELLKKELQLNRRFFPEELYQGLLFDIEHIVKNCAK